MAGTRRISLLVYGLWIAFVASAHPGIGIVKDSRGNIYYTDLYRVWKIDKYGKKTVAVPVVHTHELYMDKADNLFGEHSLYSGEATNRWSHYVWRLNAAGVLDTAVPHTDGFYIEDFSFVQDEAGAAYWVQHWKEDRLMKTGADGQTTQLATGDFKQVQWMHVANGVLYVVRRDTVFRLQKDGESTAVAKDLCGPTDERGLFGLWSDGQKNLYVANACKRAVQQITPDGVVRDYYLSGKGWSPSGGVFDDEGYLWVLEFNAANDVRAHKIKTPQAAVHPSVMKRNKPALFFAAGISGLCLLGFAAVTIRKAHRVKK